MARTYTIKHLSERGSVFRVDEFDRLEDARAAFSQADIEFAALVLQSHDTYGPWDTRTDIWRELDSRGCPTALGEWREADGDDYWRWNHHNRGA